MNLKRAGGKAGEELFRAALDGLKEPAALMDAHGRALYANAALLRAQGCAEACGRAGSQPCADCPMSCPMEDAPCVEMGGKAYERTVSPLNDPSGKKFAVLWHDIGGSREASLALRRQYEKMRRDIFQARNIQASLLPRELAKGDGYLFRSLYRPCEEMSGDIYDLLRVGRDTVAFYIADVAGHGVTAAMLTIFFSTAIRVEMRPTDMPGRVLTRVHSRFMELQLEEQNYITAFLGRLELSTGKLFWSNAGHICPPLLMRASGEVASLEMAGLPISRWVPEREYETECGQMEPGDRLVLFSDGLEARWHGAGEEGDLYAAVGRIMRESAAESCLEDIWRAVGAGEACDSHSDDATLLFVNRLAGEGNEVGAQ
jgi:sigma-B regulation protein RsbU (phosphoserine phosphatase)